jgi:Ino eighty subunit 2
MPSRPRRSAAARANEVISVHAKWADTSEGSDTRERTTMSSRRSGRHSGASAIRDAPDSPGEMSVEVASPRPRQSGRGGARRSDPFEGGEIVHGKRNRGGKKSYVVDSSPDDEEEEEEEAEIDDDEDAEGEDEMELDAEGDDVDAEGDEDADGDIDMDTSVIHPTIKVSRPTKPVISAKAQTALDDDDDEDDDELSDPGDSEPEDQTMGFGDETMADEDAEGEEIEVAGEEEEEEEEEGEEGEERDSDEDGSQAGSPDLAKMTKRQRARFEDEPQQYMKLSDGKSLLFIILVLLLMVSTEVQVKKHFTAEELSMRRQEMARRRRNLSEKRNEEVKVCQFYQFSMPMC